MAWSETHFRLTCDRSGTEHAVTVALPVRYEALDSAPLIVCMDGVWTAGAVRDATRIMSMTGEAPEAIVVGVSFTDDSMSDYLRSRTGWYTPTPWVPPDEAGVKGLVAEDCGRALTLLAFLRDQLMPRLTSDYRVGESWLLGHSFSGLFGLRTLFTEPELFDKYLLISPSIWWDDRVILDIENAYATSNPDLSASVFLSAGKREDENFPSDAYSIRGNVEELVTRLEGRGYDSLELLHAILPAETHNSTIGAAISRGLRALTKSL